MISSVDTKRGRHGNTAWKVPKHGPEKTPYLDTFHAV